jgi:hypothetical protein
MHVSEYKKKLGTTPCLAGGSPLLRRSFNPPSITSRLTGLEDYNKHLRCLSLSLLLPHPVSAGRLSDLLTTFNHIKTY